MANYRKGWYLYYQQKAANDLLNQENLELQTKLASITVKPKPSVLVVYLTAVLSFVAGVYAGVCLTL